MRVILAQGSYRSNFICNLYLYNVWTKNITLNIKSEALRKTSFHLSEHFSSSTWSTPPFTLPEANSSPLKTMVSNRNLLFQWSILRGLCYFQGKITLDPPLQALLTKALGWKFKAALVGMVTACGGKTWNPAVIIKSGDQRRRAS